MDLSSVTGFPAPVPWKRCCADPSQYLSPSSSSQGQQHHTEESLKELFRHVHDNMPNSAKKKKLLRQVLTAGLLLNILCPHLHITYEADFTFHVD
jgi:hypothetical protein